MGRVGRRGGLAGRPAGPAPACRRGIDPGLSGTLGADARAMVDAYTAGVNAYLRNYPAPPEYRLVASAPEPWEGWHCIAAMRQRGYLMGSLWFKLWRAGALGVVSAGDLAKLRYDDGGADRLCIPPGTDASRWIASLADVREPIRALCLLAASAETGGGSNNWALAPGRTATGRPILAGDPHRALELPGMYAQMHLGCDQFDAIGLTIPGMPAFPHFAHTAQVAWCVTHAFADIHDLYVGQFDQRRRVPGHRCLGVAGGVRPLRRGARPGARPGQPAANPGYPPDPPDHRPGTGRHHRVNSRQGPAPPGSAPRRCRTRHASFVQPQATTHAPALWSERGPRLTG